LKRNAKTGRIEEMEAEIEIYKNELKRIKSQIKVNGGSFDQDNE